MVSLVMLLWDRLYLFVLLQDLPSSFLHVHVSFPNDFFYLSVMYPCECVLKIDGCSPLYLFPALQYILLCLLFLFSALCALFGGVYHATIPPSLRAFLFVLLFSFDVLVLALHTWAGFSSIALDYRTGDLLSFRNVIVKFIVFLAMS